MRIAVHLAVAAALAVFIAAPAVAQSQRSVDWGTFSKDGSGEKDADWQLILDREREDGNQVDWKSFSGKQAEERDGQAAASTEQPRPAVQAAPKPATQPAPQAAAPEPTKGELRYRIGGPAEREEPPAQPVRARQAAPKAPTPSAATPQRERFEIQAPATANAPATKQPQPAPKQPGTEPLPPEPVRDAPAPAPPAHPAPVPEPAPKVPTDPTLAHTPTPAPAPAKAATPAPAKAQPGAAGQTKPAAKPRADVAVAVPPRAEAPRPRLVSDEALAHFLSLALFDKDALAAASGGEARSQVLVRWDGPVRLAIVGGDAQARRVAEAAVRAVARSLPAQDAGLALAEPGEQPNAALYILGGDGGGIDGYTEHTFQNGTIITGARIVLYQDSLTPATARRELLRALGFTGCDPAGRDSVMGCAPASGAEGGALPEMDRLALKLLYHPALEPGMSLEHARRAVEAMR